MLALIRMHAALMHTRSLLSVGYWQRKASETGARPAPVAPECKDHACQAAQLELPAAVQTYRLWMHDRADLLVPRPQKRAAVFDNSPLILGPATAGGRGCALERSQCSAVEDGTTEGTGRICMPPG